jgi:two-component system LytT family response regulator
MDNMNITTQPPATDILLLSTCKGVSLIHPGDIIKIEALSNYSKLYFANGKWLVVAKVLHWFEKRLAANQFIRIHRSYLVNKNHISQYCAGKIVLLNGEMIAVAIRKRTVFLQQLKQGAVLPGILKTISVN